MYKYSESFKKELIELSTFNNILGEKKHFQRFSWRPVIFSNV